MLVCFPCPSLRGRDQFVTTLLLLHIIKEAFLANNYFFLPSGWKSGLEKKIKRQNRCEQKLESKVDSLTLFGLFGLALLFLSRVSENRVSFTLETYGFVFASKMRNL